MDRVDLWIDESEDEPRLTLSVKAASDYGQRPRIFYFTLSMKRLRELGVDVIEPRAPEEAK